MLPASRLALWVALRGVLLDRAALARLLDFWALLGFEAPLDLLAALPLLRGLDFALADLPLAGPPLAGPAVLPLVWLPLVEPAVLPLAGPPGDLLTGVVPRSPLFAISDNRPCCSDLAALSLLPRKQQLAGAQSPSKPFPLLARWHPSLRHYWL